MTAMKTFLSGFNFAISDLQIQNSVSYISDESLCFLTIIKITMGIPKRAVTEFIGKVVLYPGIREIISLNNIIIEPIRIEPGIKKLWFVVLNIIRVKWGTAIPINPIGPQKAVIVPARMLVLIKTKIRDNLIFTPILLA